MKTIKKKLILAGGTGFLGQVLMNYFESQFDELVILSRKSPATHGKIRFVAWDATNLGPWQKELEGADALINLTGKSVDCRYTPKNKAEILRSRIDSTSVLNEAVNQCVHPPKHFINSSTATIYEHSLNRPNTEYDGIIGNDFSMNVAKSWEATFFESEMPNTIKTAIRTSIVLGNKGGAFPALRKLVQLGLGGKQGSGRQMVSWIHELDFARAIDFILHEKMAGIINLTAPNPLTNNQFMQNMRKYANVCLGLSTPSALLTIGVMIVRTETELVLKSRFVIPERLIKAGFDFQFADNASAIKNLMS